MIIFFEGGRLGNQLFQYCGLKKICPDDEIYIYGMQSLKNNFAGVNTIRSNPMLDYLVRRIGQKRFHYLSKKLGIIGFIEEKKVGERSEFIRTPGMLKNVYFCETMYFQSEDLIDQVTAAQLGPKPAIMNRAKLITQKIPEHFNEKYFVHIRRGDYATFPYPNASAMLSMEWFSRQMDSVRKNSKAPYFIIVTDDVEYAKKYFGAMNDVYVSTESEEVDLGLMSMCEGGILSASSFAWWGAYLARRNNPNALFIAPKYWWGFPLGKWMPPNIKTSWIEYVETS